MPWSDAAKAAVHAWDKAGLLFPFLLEDPIQGNCARGSD